MMLELMLTTVAICAALGFNEGDVTNDFYDNDQTHALKPAEVTVEGEIENPGPVDFGELPLRSVIVKETVLDEGKGSFVGAYRFDGYSLYDILNERKLRKKNDEEFPPIIDAYVVVENADGRKAVVSWGEIYYPVHLHEIIIATRVMRIVPSKTKDLWPLPKGSRLVVGTDLLTERNLPLPSKITVRSWPHSYTVNKGMKEMYVDRFTVLRGTTVVETYRCLQQGMRNEQYPTVFYGRGRGIHGVSTFDGVQLRGLLSQHFDVNVENLRVGLVGVAAEDGYRGVFTLSELCNRNDQSETLLLDVGEGEEGGRYKLFPAGDFFSDRAIKSVNEIRFEHAQ